MSFIEREGKILRTVKKLAEERLSFVVVGGYAVSGLGRHRFSVDGDLVIPKNQLNRFEKLLEKEGFEKYQERGEFDKVYGGKFVEYKKDFGGLPVTIDLLVESLVCRATNASWSFSYIKKHSIAVNITGIETAVSCQVPEKELLIAFKVHSGRKTDIRDTVMLRENIDWKKASKHMKRGNLDALKKQINVAIQYLKDERLVDSLRGVFRMTSDVNMQIKNTRRDLERVLKNF